MTDDDFITRLRAMATATPPVHIARTEVLRAGGLRRTARTVSAGALIVLALTAGGVGLRAATHVPDERRPVAPTDATSGPLTLPSPGEWEPPQPRTVDGATALVGANQPEGTPIVSFQAGVSGELVLLDGSCIGLRPRPDMPGELAIWPPGTTVLPGGNGIDLPGAGPIRLGQQIHHGGGYSNRGDGAPLDPAVDRCVLTAVAAVNDVMPGDDIFEPPG